VHAGLFAALAKRGDMIGSHTLIIAATAIVHKPPHKRSGKPKCYDACPNQDKALCIDEATGVTYINADECDGCGTCIEVCPFDPPRIKMRPQKPIAFKCDLCRDRAEGPICIEYCGFESLSLARKEDK